MKLGLFTSGYQRNPIEDMFIDAKRFGYDFIELWGGRPHAFPPDLKRGLAQEIVSLSKKHNVPITGYTPEHNGYPYNFMIGTEEMRREAVDYLKLSLDMASELGSEYMLISPAHAGYDTPYDVIWNRLIMTLEELTDYAEKVGIKIMLEPLTPYESNVCKSANDLKRIFDTVPSDFLVGMCDLVPPFVQAESILSYFNLLGDKMQHLHIVDSDAASDTHIMPGEGRIPLYELMQEIKERGFSGTATIELVTAYINEPRLYARRAITNVREMLK